MAKTGTIRVVNWEKYQHYKDRRPPWIKLYSKLLDHYEFSCLQDASKLHLILIWLLASKTNGELPADASWIRERIGVVNNPNLQELVTHGFITLHGVYASNMLATCKQNARLETETEKEKEKEDITLVNLAVKSRLENEPEIAPIGAAAIAAPPSNSKKQKPETQWIMDLWNASADKSLPRCTKWTAKRQTAAIARLKEYPDRESWAKAISAVNGSPFCLGENDRGWTANIDWLVIRQDTITKLIEGAYGCKAAQSYQNDNWENLTPEQKAQMPDFDASSLDQLDMTAQ